jgi:hypothetical protein
MLVKWVYVVVEILVLRLFFRQKAGDDPRPARESGVGLETHNILGGRN